MQLEEVEIWMCSEEAVVNADALTGSDILWI
jgi:hypothetical protein